MKRLSTVSLVGVCALTLVIIITTANMGLARGASLPGPLGFTPPAQTHSAGHLPAIIPQPSKIQVHAIPTFTTAEVELYLQNDPFLGTETAPFHLTYTITFLPSQTLGQQLQEDFSKDASVLCYVEFKGNGPFPLGMAKSPTAQSIPHVSKAFEVFDGQTGDLIVWGGTP